LRRHSFSDLYESLILLVGEKMKKLILSLSLLLILALMIAGCGSTAPGSDTGTGGVQEEGPAAAAETPAIDDVQPGAMATEEPGAAVAEDIATEAPNEAVAEGMATEEPNEAVAEGMATEAPNEAVAEGMATEEPLAAAETPTTGEVTEDAQADATTTEDTEVIPPTGAVNLNLMSNLQDFEVWNNNNEQVGSVNAIVINMDTSQIEYVIVGIGGFLGLGDKELPVPWQVLEVKEATAMEAESSAQTDETQVAEAPQNVFILDLSQEELEQAPEFDLTSLYESQTADPTSFQTLEQEIQSFWQSDLSQSTTDTTTDAPEADQTAGQQSDEMTQTGGARTLVLVDDLMGASVRSNTAGVSDQPTGDTQQEATETGPALEDDLGIVEEIMVDSNTGQVSYVLVSLNAVSAAIQEAPASDPASGETEQSSAAATMEPQAVLGQVIAVPLTALEWNAEETVLFYTGSESLDQAPAINLDELLSDQSTTDWKSQADSFWGVEGSETETP
jgi:sporulation protein YlmC with PRC-barrel domain